MVVMWRALCVRQAPEGDERAREYDLDSQHHA